MSRRRTRLAAAGAAATMALVVLLASAAAGHRLAPSLLELRAHPDGRVDALWKTPRQVARGGAAPEPVLPERCRERAPRRAVADGGGLVLRLRLHCPGGLAGARLAVRGLGASRTDALVRVRRADGTWQRRILRAGEAAWQVPAARRPLALLRGAAGLGVRHLAGGLDHLLFLLGLVALVRGRRLLLAVSAFTAGHATTLALAAGGALTLPPALVEVAIAASLVALALEIVRTPGAGPGLLARRPAAPPFAFGLVHGLGFAGALRESGFTTGELPLTLAGFHAGLELAQLAAVAAFLLGARLAAPLARRAPRLAREAPATLLGAAGSWLALARLSAMLGGPAGVLGG